LNAEVAVIACGSVDYLARQEAARRRARWLVPGFVVAVFATGVALYGAIVLPFGIWQGIQAKGEVLIGQVWFPTLFGLVLRITCLSVAAGSLWKLRQLRRGGPAVAELLAGRLVRSDTRFADERQLLNVVAEMAVASGSRVPPVYVLEWDQSVNAFSAGRSLDDAVLGVSQGALHRLSRDELQAVVAHEFSHILNGDILLKHRLMGLVHGLMVIALTGENMIEWSGRSLPEERLNRREVNHNRARGFGEMLGRLVLLVVGFTLSLIGFIGAVAARTLKAAVCRQREYLADAAAVQMTRLARGLAGALKQAELFTFDRTLRRVTIEETGHLFFNNSYEHRLSDFADTHPPITERIRRLEPMIALELERARLAATAPAVRPSPPREVFDPDQSSVLLTEAGAEHLEAARAWLASLPDAVRQAMCQSATAKALVLALLAGEDARAHAEFTRCVQAAGEPAIAEEMLRLLPFTSQTSVSVRLPLVELAIPALRELPVAEFERFEQLVDQAIRLDQQMSVFEFALQHLLRRHLRRQFHPGVEGVAEIKTLQPLRAACGVLLSTLAHAGSDEGANPEAAFRRGGRTLGYAADDFSLLPLEECHFSALEQALAKLDCATPQVKRRILDAAVQTVAGDGCIRVNEVELLRAFADALGCPTPAMRRGYESA
jgi:Zn-dependent protease with chaperone function